MVRVSLVTADTAARMASRVWTHGGAGWLSSTHGWAGACCSWPSRGRLTAATVLAYLFWSRSMRAGEATANTLGRRSKCAHPGRVGGALEATWTRPRRFVAL
jgi:hypothetical protein